MVQLPRIPGYCVTAYHMLKCNVSNPFFPLSPLMKTQTTLPQSRKAHGFLSCGSVVRVFIIVKGTKGKKGVADITQRLTKEMIVDAICSLAYLTYTVQWHMLRHHNKFYNQSMNYRKHTLTDPQQAKKQPKKDSTYRQVTANTGAKGWYLFSGNLCPSSIIPHQSNNWCLVACVCVNLCKGVSKGSVAIDDPDLQDKCCTCFCCFTDFFLLFLFQSMLCNHFYCIILTPQCKKINQ